MMKLLRRCLHEIALSYRLGAERYGYLMMGL